MRPDPTFRVYARRAAFEGRAKGGGASAWRQAGGGHRALVEVGRLRKQGDVYFAACFSPHLYRARSLVERDQGING